MKQTSLDERVAALERLQGEAATGRYQANQRLNAIDKLLFLTADFCESDLHRILRKSEYSPAVARSIRLYVMMARVTALCEPKGSAIGPACALKLIDFENLTRDGVLDVKGVAGFRLYFSLPGIVHKDQRGTQFLIEPFKSDEISFRWHKYEYGPKFNALDFLSPNQKDLYYRAKPFFIGKKKPTLKSLAASLLKEEGDEGYSERSLSRYIQAFRDFKFADQDIRRTMLIRSVESFGADHKSMRQMQAECFPELVAAVQRAITSAATSLIPFITQMQLLFTSIADRLHLTPGSKVSQN